MTDSYNSLECIICFYNITPDQPYSMINNKYEKYKCHVECLERWINKSHNGLCTQNEIKSYSIYQQGNLIETVRVENHIPNNDNNNSTAPLLSTTTIDDVTVPLLPIIKTNTKTPANESMCKWCVII